MARVCCAALFDPAALNKSFDLASKPEGEGEVSVDAAVVFKNLGGRSCSYSMVTDSAPDPPSIF